MVLLRNAIFVILLYFRLLLIIRDISFVSILSLCAQAIFKEAMTATYKQLNLQVIDNQLDKAMQLFHTLRAYSGVILIGGPGGGKTTLHYALSKMLSNPETNRHGFCVCDIQLICICSYA